MNDRGVEFEFCHVLVMDDEEMDVLKLLAQGVVAISQRREPPTGPTSEQSETMLRLFERVLEM